MSGLGTRVALVVASLAAGTGAWVVTQRLSSEDSASGTALMAVDYYGCGVTDATTATGATSQGQLHAGDRVWLIGVSGDRWAVIRRPGRPDQPAWLPMAAVATEARRDDLPDLSCAAAVAATTTTATPTPATTSPASVPPSPPTTVGLGTTTSSSTSTTSTTTTLLTDTIPPTVTVTADRAYLYVATGTAPCNAETTLEVTIVVADPSVPLTIRSIVATWASPAGPQTANLAPVAGNRFALSVPTNGPATGETPLTLAATGSDGAGNV
ncbi:MAG: hypothetical protein WCC60_16895, partial [Ilumatobacteraceae bacterium]